MTKPQLQRLQTKQRRPVIFLDIDGVLNFTKHNTEIHLEKNLVSRLKHILEQTHAIIVLTTFWRHFHEYICYVLHRHGIDVAGCMLDMPMGVTPGKQSTKKFVDFHRVRLHQQRQNDNDDELLDQNEPQQVLGGVVEINADASDSMIGRSAQDEGEYTSRAEEIEAWLRMYGERYLGSHDGDISGYGSDDGKKIDGTCPQKIITNNNYEDGRYEFHPKHWKYVILDDRPSAAKPDTPLFNRFVLTNTSLGLSEKDANLAIELLLFGPKEV